MLLRWCWRQLQGKYTWFIFASCSGNKYRADRCVWNNTLWTDLIDRPTDIWPPNFLFKAFEFIINGLANLWFLHYRENINPKTSIETAFCGEFRYYKFFMKIRDEFGSETTNSQIWVTLLFCQIRYSFFNLPLQLRHLY